MLELVADLEFGCVDECCLGDVVERVVVGGGELSVLWRASPLCCSRDLEIDEVVIVTAGELTVETDTTTRTIGPGHVVVLPPGTPHRLSNRGAAPVIMLAAAAWNHATFYREASTYLEGEPRQ